MFLSVALAVGSTVALAQRQAELARVAQLELDRAGLDLIEARVMAMNAATELRIASIGEGWRAPQSEPLDVSPVIEAAERLGAAVEPLASSDTPLATEASLLIAELDDRLDDPPESDGYVDRMSFVDDLAEAFCCAGQNGWITGVSDRIRTIDYLGYGHGAVSYFLDDVAGGFHVRDQVEVTEGGFTDYMSSNAGVAAEGLGFGDIEDPLMFYFPDELESGAPNVAQELEAVLSSDDAVSLRSALVWAVEGGAGRGEAFHADFDQVVDWLTGVYNDQSAYMSTVITAERAEIDRAIASIEATGVVLLVGAIAGFVTGGALFGSQVRQIRRIQLRSDFRRNEAQAKLDMLAVVAHELRTPLTGITGFTKLLATEWEQMEDDQIREFLALIDGQADVLMRLIDDLLTIRRLESGNLDLHPTVVNVSDLAHRVAGAVFRAGDRTVQIDVGPVDAAFGDPDRMAQILRNLLDNARKYGGPTVRVATGEGTDGRLRISVIDDGPGVSAADSERIFARFDQGSTRGRAGTGFGLGLAIVKDLARAMGGDVGYLPGVSGGSEFWVDLPPSSRVASVPVDA